jgi:hypothetical protein
MTMRRVVYIEYMEEGRTHKKRPLQKPIHTEVNIKLYIGKIRFKNLKYLELAQDMAQCFDYMIMVLSLQFPYKCITS